MRPVAVGSRDSGTWRAETTRTSKPTGTLMRKIQRHDAGGDEVAPEQRSGGRGHPAEARPGADGAAPVVGAERGLEDGQAPRGEQCRPHPLEDPGHDEDGGPGASAQATDATVNQTTPTLNIRRRP